MLRDETIQRVLRFRDDRDWRQFHTPKDLAISLSLEAAELLEVFQWSGADLECRDKLERGLADVGIVRAPVYMEQCEQIFLRSEPWVAAMSRNHPLAGEAGDEVRLERLGGETLMVPVRASLQEEINHWFNEIAQDREILCYYNSSASMLPMVERGMGIAICPGSARYFTGGDGIVYKTIVEPRKESRLYMVKRRYQMLPQAAGAFWDFVCSTFPPA